MWTFYEIGYVFHFQKECLGGMDRDGLNRTLKEIEALDDPLTYHGLLSTCPQRTRIVTRILDSFLLLALIVNLDDNPNYPHSIELVKIIDPKEIDLTLP